MGKLHGMRWKWRDRTSKCRRGIEFWWQAIVEIWFCPRALSSWMAFARQNPDRPSNPRPLPQCISTFQEHACSIGTESDNMLQSKWAKLTTGQKRPSSHWKESCEKKLRMFYIRFSFFYETNEWNNNIYLNPSGISQSDGSGWWNITYDIGWYSWHAYKTTMDQINALPAISAFHEYFRSSRS